MCLYIGQGLLYYTWSCCFKQATTIMLQFLYSLLHGTICSETLAFSLYKSQPGSQLQLASLVYYINRQTAKTKNTSNSFNTLFSHMQFFTPAYKSQMTKTIECARKPTFFLVQTKVFLKMVLLQKSNGLCSPTLFVLLWFGTGSKWSGQGKTGQIEHGRGLDVLMSSVCALHCECNCHSNFSIV